MKPKTKYQKLAVELNESLPSITPAQRGWAYRNCIEHIGRRTPKGKTTCMECAHEWVDTDKNKKRCVCPACGAKLTIENTLQRKFRQVAYINIITTFKGQQVIRTIFVSADFHIGYKAKYSSAEVVQRWVSPEGKHATLALSRHMGFYIDLWNFGSTMEVRSNSSIYDKLPHCTYPHKSYIPELKRSGFTGDFHKIPPYSFFIYLLSDSRAETLLKTGQTELFKYFADGYKKLSEYWPSIRIALRNGYNISNASDWVDYIDQLRFFGKDLHNAKYVCPEDLCARHNRYVRKRHELQQRERERQRREKALQDDVIYREQKSRFFGIGFTDGVISVRTLESVDEIMQEGKSMHHCVFANNYHLREDSLLLSACIDGERIETIEFSLSRLIIIQSRGLCNKTTPYHDQIIDLVNKNIPIIRQRMVA